MVVVDGALLVSGASWSLKATAIAQVPPPPARTVALRTNARLMPRPCDRSELYMADTPGLGLGLGLGVGDGLVLELGLGLETALRSKVRTTKMQLLSDDGGILAEGERYMASTCRWC